MSYYDPLREHRPAWYGFSYEAPATLLLHIHRAAMEYLVSHDFTRFPIVQDRQKRLPVPAFINPTNDRWGYGEALVKRESIGPDWKTFACAIPAHAEENAQSNMWAIRATLEIVFKVLSLFPDDRPPTNSSFNQLILIRDMRVSSGGQGGSILATFTKAAAEILARRFLQGGGPRQLTDLEEAMFATYKHVINPEHVESVSRWSFKALFEYHDVVTFMVPGSGANLSAESPYRRQVGGESGYELASHNIDGCRQQMALFAGLGWLHDFMLDPSS